MKRRGRQCKAGIYLRYHAENDQVTIYKTEVEHSDCVEKVRCINRDVRKCVEALYNDGIMKPKQIIQALPTSGIKIPTIIQL